MPRLAFLLPALACALLLSACDKVDSLKKGVQSTLSSSTETGGGGGSGSGGTAPGDAGGASAGTPALTLQAYKDAIAKQDYDKLYGMMSGEFQRRTRAEVDRMKKVITSGTEAEKREVVEKIKIGRASCRERV